MLFSLEFIDLTDGMFYTDMTTGVKSTTAPVVKQIDIPEANDPNDTDWADPFVKDNIIKPLTTLIGAIGSLHFGVRVKATDTSQAQPEEILKCTVQNSGGSVQITATDIALMRPAQRIADEFMSYAADLVIAASTSALSILNSSVSPNNVSANAGSGMSDIDKLIEQIRQKTKADIVKPTETLADYVCEDSLKDQLLEIQDFLENQAKYVSAGIALPKGVLFKGVPGTGKTYAARCIAGSTKCYFMVCTASSLQGMYIGSGAENIRNLFQGAKTLHEASKENIVVFIDELDSLGSREGHTGNTGGEEDRTLNQLLAELSGFEDSDGIMVLGATNYPDRIDSALMRSGRFSRQITIDVPNDDERIKLIEYYFGKIKIPIDVETNSMEIASLTEGMTPADIKEIANEAGIMAIRKNTASIILDDINEAINKTITKNVRRPDGTTDTYLVAAHECGHALAEILYNKAFPIKLTNYSYGSAGGFTQNSNRMEGLISKEKYENEIRTLVAGRAAERVLQNVETTGASNDYSRAKKLIRQYYTTYQFSTYDAKDLDNVIISDLDKFYTEVVNFFKEPENKKTLQTLTDTLASKRVLYKKDLSQYINVQIYKAEDIL